MIFNAENFDIFRLGAVAVSYPPKRINTVALLVSAENIGALSLEFEAELLYNQDGEPTFSIMVQRGGKEGLDIRREVFEGDWLVILWNEIRIFRQEEFEHTFQIDHMDYDALQKHAKEDALASTKIFPKTGDVHDPHQNPLTNPNKVRKELGLKPYPDLTEVGEKREPGETQD